MEKIGEGATSNVFKVVIVIKQKDYNLKGAPEEDIRCLIKDTDDSFDREIRFFKLVGEHKNIVKFIGLYNKSILLEYMPNGSVVSYYI